MNIRIDKLLGELNFGSRAELKKQMKAGVVQVNGVPVLRPETKVDPECDQIFYKNKKVEYSSVEYYILNKPKGYVSARKDNLYPTVIELVDSLRKDLSPVGRLDVDTEGLLLITNDGALSHYLLSPQNHIEKTYFFRLDKPCNQELIQEFLNGVHKGFDPPTRPAILKLDPLKPTEGTLIITEGRFHQVKRMFLAYDYEVIYLKRIAMGKMQLEEKEIPLGHVKKLSQEEVQFFFQREEK